MADDLLTARLWVGEGAAPDLYADLLGQVAHLEPDEVVRVVDALVFAAYVGVCATAATGRPDDVPDFSAALRAIVAAVHDHAARPC